MASLFEVWLILVLLNSTAIYAVTVTEMVEGKALLAFKKNLTDSAALTNWEESDEDPCKWVGVRCDESGYVTTLNFVGLNISGSLVPELGDFANLTALYLDHNKLTGKVPLNLTVLIPKIGVVDMTNNLNLTGSCTTDPCTKP